MKQSVSPRVTVTVDGPEIVTSLINSGAIDVLEPIIVAVNTTPGIGTGVAVGVGVTVGVGVAVGVGVGVPVGIGVAVGNMVAVGDGEGVPATEVTKPR